MVVSSKYHKDIPLTYSFDINIENGSIVELPLINQKTLGIVIKKINKPLFKTKAIDRVIVSQAISKNTWELYQWLKAYYPAPSGITLGLFVPSFLLVKVKSETTEKELSSDLSRIKLPPLTDEQTAAKQIISKTFSHSIMLHGNTGSGKTRVYIESAIEVIKKGRSVIVLTPEIGLTPQLIESFNNTFPGKIITLHSNMTPKERAINWHKISSATSPQIIIGPRSALFSPIKNLGLIVVDEMHDSSFKQEQAPYYLATRVAAKLAEINKAKVIFGSATPSITDYYIFKQNNLPIIRMKKMAAGSTDDAEIGVIDLRDKDKFIKSSWISDDILELINKAIKKKEQSLIFLNRRGTARIILCQICGWQSLCPRCDLPLTYHGDNHKAVCHTCGYYIKAPTSCANCGSAEIIFKSIGTKSIVSELNRYFPEARISRFDSDLKKVDRLENNYLKVRDGNTDILVGTQMLAKGLDLPKLSLVGIVLADTSLGFPDYTAQERTFQLINQVIGRVGRGHRKTNVAIQTYSPESAVIKYAATKDYEGFYSAEISERKKYMFPPFCYLLKLTCSRKSVAGAEKAAMKLFDELSNCNNDSELIGPAPSFIEKNNGSYYWQIIIKSKKRSNLTRIINNLPPNWMYDIDPIHLL